MGVCVVDACHRAELQRCHCNHSSCILHRQHRYIAQWCNWCTIPCAVPCTCARKLGVLGFLRCYPSSELRTRTNSSVAIISRVILAVFWFAIQTANGGDVVQVMITAIWPGFANLPNHIPDAQGITTAGMISFFLCKPPCNLS